MDTQNTNVWYPKEGVAGGLENRGVRTGGLCGCSANFFAQLVLSSIILRSIRVHVFQAHEPDYDVSFSAKKLERVSTPPPRPDTPAL